MGFFSDLFGKAQGQTKNQRKAYEPIQMARKEGTLYYLRARNVRSGFDDTLCFNDDVNRQRYIDTARTSTPSPGDWYFNEWEISAESRLQKELEKQRIAIEKSYEEEINSLKFYIHKLTANPNERMGIYTTSPGGSTKLLRQVSDLQQALRDEQSKNKKLKAEYDKLSQKNNSSNEDNQKKYRLLLDEHKNLQEKFNWLINQIKSKLDRKTHQKQELQEPIILQQQELDFQHHIEAQTTTPNLPSTYNDSIYRLTAFNSVEILEINDTDDTIRFRWINDGQPEKTHRAKIRDKDGERVFKSYHLTIPLNKKMQITREIKTPLEPVANIISKMNLQELNTLCYTVLTSQDSSTYASIAHDFEQELKNVDAHAPMQGRLILAILQRYINENR